MKRVNKIRLRSKDTSNTDEDEHSQIILSPLSQWLKISQAQSTSTIQLKEKDLGDWVLETKKCMICLLPIKETDRVRSCPQCQGEAHINHLQTWLRAKKFCPMCRVDFPRDFLRL